LVELNSCSNLLIGIPETPEYPDGEARYDNSLGIFEAGEEYAQVDLDLFFANFTPNIPQGTAPIPALIDGSIASTDVAHAGGEPELDFEIAYPLIYPQTITVFQAPGFNNMLDAIDGVSSRRHQGVWNKVLMCP
jgi:tripeptidyl-peptidase-1